MTKKLIKKLKEKRQSKKLTKSHKPKKNIFLKIFISLFGSLLLLAFISIVYFLVLISVEYKSFPFITKTIEKKINQSISAGVTDGNSISIEQSSIKFNKLHIIEVVIDGIKLHIAGSEEFAKDIVLPKIDAEFSISSFKACLASSVFSFNMNSLLHHSRRLMMPFMNYLAL